MPDKILGRLEILQTLGEGQFGRVHRAFDHVLNKEVAVKEFFRMDLEKADTSFQTEMKVLAHLHHPALLKVYDLLVDDTTGSHFLTEELIAGRDASKVLKEADWEIRWQLFAQLLQGLEYLHQRGIIHLDIKPPNVLVSAPAHEGGIPQARILDFGVADEIGKFDKKGLIAGTFPYMAPEVVRGDHIDGRADLYSLGMMFFEVFKRPSPLPDGPAGEWPGGGEAGGTVAADASDIAPSTEALIQETLNRTAPLRTDFQDDVPESFREVLITLLDPNPRRRFWSANDVIRRLNARVGRRFLLEPGRLRIPDKATAVLSGRAEEFKEVVGWMEQFQKTDATLFLGVIEGRAQSGKSAVLEEVRRWAELADRFVVSLRGPSEGPAELFMRLMHDSDVKDLEPLAPFLKALLPARFGSAEDPPELETRPELLKARVLEKHAEALALLLKKRPVILLVDDVDQKKDLAELLTFLGRVLHEAATASAPPGKMKTFLLMTASASEGLMVDPKPSHTLTLKNWSKPTALAVLNTLLAVEHVPEKLLQKLMEKTEGMPGLLVEYVRLLVNEVLKPGEDIEGQLDALDWRNLDASLDLAAWYQGDVERLDNQERSILRWLSLTSLELAAEDLELLDPPLVGQAAAAIRKLQDLGWVRQGPSGYQLSSELRREASYREIPPADEFRMRLLLGEKWEDLSLSRFDRQGESEGVGLERAHQFFLGGDSARAFALAKPEIQLMLKLNRPEPVVQFLSSHDIPAQALPEEPRRQYRKFLAQAFLQTANFPGATEGYGELLSESQEPRERAELAVALARAHRYGGQLKEAAETIRQARAQMDETSPFVPNLDSLLADILVEHARYDEAAGIAQPYLTGGRPCHVEEALAFRHAVAKVHFYHGRIEEAIELSKLNVTESQRSGRPSRHALALNMLGAAYLKQGNIAEATPLFHSCSAISAEIGDLRTMALACVNLGMCYHETGDLEASIKYHEKAAAMFRRISDRSYEARLLYNLGQLRREAGDFEAAEDVLADATRLTQELHMAHIQAKIRLERSDCFRARGLFARAAEECASAETIFRDLNIPAEILAARLKRIEITIDAGEPGAESAASTELAECEKDPLLHESPILDIKALYVKGRLVSKRSPAQARKLLEQAMTKLEAMPGPDPELKQRISDAFRHATPGSESPAEEHRPIEPMKEEREMPERTQTLPVASAPPPRDYPATVVAATPAASDLPRPAAPLRRRSDIESLSLLEVVRKINSPLDVQDVLVEIVDSLVGFMDAERGFLLLVEEDKLAVRVARSKEKKDVRDPAESFSLSIAQESLDQAKPIITLDAAKDPRFKEAASVGQLQLKSAVSVPLFMKGEALGAIYLDTRLKTGRFTEQDVPMLSALAELAALAIFRAQLIAQNVRDQRELRRSLKETKETKQKVDQLNTELENSNRKLQETVQHQEEELTSAQRRLQDLVHDEQPKYKYERIVGNSPGMRQVLLQLDRAVEMRVPVLLVGKSGTGKELMARAIHYNSPSKDQPFVAVNCTAIPQELVESELFGHVRGAFTGADRDKPGLFETAEGGALFLDEIGDVPLAIQAKLLRVLQESTVRRVGGNTEKKVDVRVIAATNVDLKDLVAQKKFREDLYYRLRVFRISIPPLRERREDIQGLTEYFLKEIARQYRVPAKTLSKAALRLLVGYDWPGNVRELENTLRSAFVLSKNREIQVEDLRQMEELFGEGGPAPVREGLGLREALLEFQKNRIENALRRHDGSVTEAAKELQVDRSQLSHWIRKFKLADKSN
ncbi:MAG: sigma 54-interacting transcriptional regulator [Nitrospirae bacterium]|nr:sigma 54-interacting transcriptional regulator [Nitrospirota bacterium]